MNGTATGNDRQPHQSAAKGWGPLNPFRHQRRGPSVAEMREAGTLGRFLGEALAKMIEEEYSRR